jgi:hypothetical protein
MKKMFVASIILILMSMIVNYQFASNKEVSSDAILSSLNMQKAYGEVNPCDPGWIMVNGVCVARQMTLEVRCGSTHKRNHQCRLNNQTCSASSASATGCTPFDHTGTHACGVSGCSSTW